MTPDAQLDPDPDLLSATLRDALIRAASRGRATSLGREVERREAAEDLVQDTLAEALVEQLRPGAPPAEVRVRARLKNKIVDWERRRATRADNEVRAKADDHEMTVEQELPASIDADSRLGRIFRHLQNVLKSEEFVFVLLKYIGCTDEQIATTVSGWDTQRVTRVRRRLSRNKRALVDEINAYADDYC